MIGAILLNFHFYSILKKKMEFYIGDALRSQSCVQTVVGRMYLSIEIHSKLLLSFQNSFKHCFNLTFLSLWWWILVV